MAIDKRRPFTMVGPHQTTFYCIMLVNATVAMSIVCGPWHLPSLALFAFLLLSFVSFVLTRVVVYLGFFFALLRLYVGPIVRDLHSS